MMRRDGMMKRYSLIGPYGLDYLKADPKGDLVRYEDVPGWVKLKDRLPDPETEEFYGGPEGSYGCGVILWFHKYKFESAYFDYHDKKFYVSGMSQEVISRAKYWMIPNHPEKDDD